MSLPCNLDAERFVLGSILLDDLCYPEAAAGLTVDDFSLESHRRTFRRMADVKRAGGTIDRVTVANALMSASELDSVGGLSWLITLDDGIPHIPNIGDYVRIVRDKSTLRKVIEASTRLTEQAQLESAQPDALLAEAGRSFLSLAERGAESTLLAPSAIIEAGGGINVYLDRKNRTTGTPSGYPGIDLYTGGFKPGTLTILAARPAMGKTALALNIAERVAMPSDGEPRIVPVFSLEMSKEELIDRLICSRARVNTKKFDGGWMNAEESARAGRAAGEIAAADSLLIDDKANTNTQEIHAKIRKQQVRGAVALVIVDYLQLLINAANDSERVAATSRISRDLKLIAKDCHVPVVALSQLNRKCEERGSLSNPDGYRPMLQDLRESGSIEQDADIVMALCRLEVYLKERPEFRGVADLELLKQRGGPIGRIPLTWLAEIVRFEQGGVREEE